MARLLDLHQLIHSINKSEKRHVTQCIQAFGGKAKERYLRALKALNNNKDFDEKSLKAALSEGTAGMNLSEANSNLYEFVLNALMAYKKSGVNDYAKKLLQIEFLLKNKMYERAHLDLVKLMPKLEELDSYALLQRAHELEEIITIQYAPVNRDYNFRQGFFESRLETADKTKLNLEFLNLKFNFFHLAKTIGTPRNINQFNKYRDLWKMPILQIPREKISNRSLHSYYQIKGALMSVIQLPNAELEIRKQIADYTTRLKGKKASKGTYDILDILISLISTKEKIDFEDVKMIAKRFKILSQELENPNYALLMANKVVMLYILYFLKEKKYEEGISYFEEQIRPSNLKKWGSAPLAYNVYIFSATIHFLNGKTEESLQILLDIQDQEKKMRPTYLINYQFLKLLCHYKLGHHEYLESATRSLQRTLYKNDVLYSPERALLHFLSHGNNIDRLAQNFKKLHSSFIKLKDNKHHRIFFDQGSYLELIKYTKKNL